MGTTVHRKPSQDCLTRSKEPGDPGNRKDYFLPYPEKWSTHLIVKTTAANRKCYSLGRSNKSTRLVEIQVST